MKRLLIILGLGLTIGLANVNTVEAQLVNVYVNIDMQPAWGPAGFDYAAFYYFPALNIYYDVNNALFYYLSGRRWLFSRFLPVRYQRYDFYAMYKVVMNDYHNPWIHNRLHRSAYSAYRNVRTQMPIRSMTADHRYNIARTNTRAWVEQRPAPANNRSSRSTVARTTPNTRNNNATASQNRNATTANRNSNVAASQNRNTTTTSRNSNATASQNRNATTANRNNNATASQNRNATTTNRNNNVAPSQNRNTTGASVNQTQNNRNQRNNQSVNNPGTTTRSNQNVTATTRSSRSESRNTSVGSNRQNNNSGSSSTTGTSGSTRSSRSR